jgi:glutathione S-transferase
MVHWERGTKLRYGIVPCDEQVVQQALELFHIAAQLLEKELTSRSWLVGN